MNNMKKVLTIIALGAFTTTSVFAQENKNKQKETVTTKTAVKSEKGVDISTKEVTKTQKQAVTLSERDANRTNQEMIVAPAKINTEVNYDYEGNRYKFINQKDQDGYRMMTVQDNATHQEYAIIKPTSKNGYYIMSQDGDSSFGYFNEDGDFVVEKYDATKDDVISTVYRLNQTGGIKPIRNTKLDVNKNNK